MVHRITLLAIASAVGFCVMNVSAAEDGSKEFVLNDLDAPIGTLEFASIHESGHVVAAKSVGFTVSGASVFQLSKPGIGLYWKGTTRIRGSGRGMAVAKMGGNFAEFFLDQHNRFRVPSFLDIVGNRNVISQTDVITSSDLYGESLTEAQHRTYRALTANASMLNRIYLQLKTKRSYP